MTQRLRFKPLNDLDGGDLDGMTVNLIGNIDNEKMTDWQTAGVVEVDFPTGQRMTVFTDELIVEVV